MAGITAPGSPADIERVSTTGDRSSETMAESGRSSRLDRPATAERELLREIGRHRRRGQLREAGSLALDLGYLLLLHGRLQAAHVQASRAQQICDEGQWACGRTGAVQLEGWILLTEYQPSEAETAFRKVEADVEAHVSCLCSVGARLGLARALIDQRRCADASAILQSLANMALSSSDPCKAESRLGPLLLDVAHAETQVRLALAEHRVNAAAGWLEGVRRVRQIGSAPDLAALALCDVLLAGARGQPREAADACAAGLRAARTAHAPLMAFEMRAAYAASLVQMERWKEAERLVARVRRFSRMRGPGFVRRLDELQIAIDRGRHRPPGARAAGSVQLDAEDVLHVLHVCAEHEDTGPMLAAVCQALRTSTGASGVAVFGRCSAAAPLGAAGCRLAWSGQVRLAIESGRPSEIADVLAGGEAIAPLVSGGSVVGALAARWPIRDVPDAARHMALLQSAACAVAPAVRAAAELPHDQVRPGGVLAEFAGSSAATTALRREIAAAAAAPFPVLIQGESGSGKELVAKSIHAASDRRSRRFCAVNCAALPDELCEAELFGHARGAFTGAASDRSGLFEEADGGTLLLDEVGELSLRAQAKLLRVIQEGEIRRLGENSHRRVDARIVAATNQPLHTLVGEGRFRRDLLFRLDVIRIIVPPLRDRPEDILPLTLRIWRAASSRLGSRAELTPSAITALASYEWPGNVRELQNILYSVAAHAPRQGRVSADRLPPHIVGAQVRSSVAQTLEAGRREFDRAFVRDALLRASGRRAFAAMQLGVTRQGLAKLMARLEITLDQSAQVVAEGE